MESMIENPSRIRQVIDFAGIRIGAKGMPTDCDGLVEYRGRGYILFELKHGSKDLPFGQKLALTRMCDDFERLHKPACLIVAEHHVDDPNESIDAALCDVRCIYFKGKWRNPKSELTLKEAIDRFIFYIDRR